MMVMLYAEFGSKYKSYIEANYGNIFLRDPGIFALPSFLYSYWIFKMKVKTKGSRKVSMTISEFQESIAPEYFPFSKSIIVYNCQFDFESLLLIDDITEKQLMVLDSMHQAVLKIAKVYSWKIEDFETVYLQAYENIRNDSVPEKFWDVKL